MLVKRLPFFASKDKVGLEWAYSLPMEELLIFSCIPHCSHQNCLIKYLSLSMWALKSIIMIKHFKKHLLINSFPILEAFFLFIVNTSHLLMCRYYAVWFIFTTKNVNSICFGKPNSMNSLKLSSHPLSTCHCPIL